MKYYHFQIRKKTANQALNILKTVPEENSPPLPIGIRVWVSVRVRVRVGAVFLGGNYPKTTQNIYRNTRYFERLQVCFQYSNSMVRFRSTVFSIKSQ